MAALPTTFPTPTSTLPDYTKYASSVQDILGLNTTATEDAAKAAAAAAQAQGQAAEVAAYSTAEQIGLSNADLETLSGQLRAFQQQRQVAQTIGAQKAGVAAAGFADAGTAVNLMQSSLQQGYLGEQLIQFQSAITRGGYLEETAAARAESAAAQAAGTQSLITSAAATAAGGVANAQAGALSNALLANLQALPASEQTDAMKSFIADLTGGNTTAALGDITNLITQQQQGLLPAAGTGAGGPFSGLSYSAGGVPGGGLRSTINPLRGYTPLGGLNPLATTYTTNPVTGTPNIASPQLIPPAL